MGTDFGKVPRCPKCRELRRPLLSPPASLRDPPKSELTSLSIPTSVKIKGALWFDRATRTCSVSILQTYKDPVRNASSSISSRISWCTILVPKGLPVTPLCTSQQKMSHFLGRIGVGHITPSPEAHTFSGLLLTLTIQPYSL